MTATGPLGPGFEWFVAWRHLRDPERRVRWLLWVGIAVLVVGGLLFGVSLYLAQRARPATPSFFPTRQTLLVANLRLLGLVVIGTGVFLTLVGILFANFTVFTAIPILGVFVGTAGPIVVLSVMSGFEMDLKTKIRGAKADVVVTPADDQPFTDADVVQKQLLGLPGVVAVTPFLEAEVIVRGGVTPAGIVVRGIDPKSAARVLDLGKPTLREGDVSDLAEPRRVMLATRSRWEKDEDVLPTIILGEELYARMLRLFMGSRVEVICPLCGVSPSGPTVKTRDFRVSGHFYSGMYEFDSKLAYIALDEAQKFMNMPGEVSGIDIRARTPEEATAVAAAATALLGPRYQARSWEELNKSLFMALRLEKIAFFIALAFIALVASFSIISNLIMMVTEKGREIAILKSMGARDGAILRIFIAEGLYIGLIGMGAGVSIGFALCRLIERFGLSLPTDVYYISNLPVVTRGSEIGIVALMALVLCSLATLYPAMLAARLRPVRGLRYE